MTTRNAAEPEQDDEAVGLDDFFDRVANSDPFQSGRVSDPSAASVDVPSIHQHAFDELRRAAEMAHAGRASLGVVVWGEAGIGKSHLLARLCHWADREGRSIYVFLHNIQAAPERLPRYLLRCVISRLTCGRTARFHGTPLYWLVTSMVRKGLESWPSPATPVPPSWARNAYFRVVEQVLGENPNAGVDARTVYEVLFRFFQSANLGHQKNEKDEVAALAVRWLAGEDLDAEEILRLGLARSAGGDHAMALVDDDAVKTVLVALAEMAWFREQSFAFLFDQADNLDAEQVSALTRFLHTLVDHGRNLLVVTSGVKQKLLDFLGSGAILQAAWERVSQEELTLTRIGRDGARRLIEARLEQFLEPFVTLPGIKERVSEDCLFPLGRPWLDERLGDLVELRPRDAVNWSRDRWREEQARFRQLGGPAWLENWAAKQPSRAPVPPEVPLEALIDAKVRDKIQEQIARRELEPAMLPPYAANMSGLVESLLKQCQGEDRGYAIESVSRPSGKAGRLPVYHLVLHRADEDGARFGLVFLTTASATSATAALRRIKSDEHPPCLVILVTDARQPVVLGPTGKEYFRELLARGPERFQHIELTFHEYAELDALQAVVGDARSGDLEVDLPGGVTRAVSEAEVIASHHRQNRYRENRLLGMLLAAGARGTRREEYAAAVGEVVRPAVGRPAGSETRAEREETRDEREELPGSRAAGRAEGNESRQFILAQLSLKMGATTRELAARYVADHGGAALEPESCRRRLEEEARRMHGEGLIQVTPLDDQLYLLLK